MKRARQVGLWLSALLGALAALTPAAAQADRASLEIVRIDASAYPEISLTVRGTDADGRGLVDPAGISLEEDGEPVEEFAVTSSHGGMSVVFVVDANETFDLRDQAEGPTRREKTRDSIVRFANLYLDPAGLDLTGIVVPDGDGGRFLDRPELRLADEVIDAVNAYEPGELRPTPLDAMMSLALRQAAGEVAGDRFRAVVLISDAAAIGDQLDFDPLVARAQQAGVTFYALILGSRADPAEVDNVARLTEPTIGRWVHLPEPPAADALYTWIHERATQHRITYDSTLTGSGEHTVAVEHGGARAQATIALRVEPPAVTLASDAGQTIRRVATAAGAPLEDLEPKIQPLVAQVSWPDSLPRSLAAAALRIDSREAPLQAPVLDDSGRLTFDWDISRLDEGAYEVQVEVTDELGLVGVSEPLVMTIAIERPDGPASATPSLLAPATPGPVQTTGLIPGVPDRLLAIGGAGLGLLALILLFAARNRRRRMAAAPAAAPVPGAGAALSAAGLPAQTVAYLEAVENAPEHSGPIPIEGPNVALGRDPWLAQVHLSDHSVSRLHARIIATGGVYRLHDEGSAGGTYVNFERVGLAPRLLKDNDDIHLGRVRLRFHLRAPEDRAGRADAVSAGEPADGAETRI